MVMKKINTMVALIMLLTTSITCTKNEQVEASICVYDRKPVFSSDFHMIKETFSEEISIIYGDVESYSEGGATFVLRKNLHIIEAYIVGFTEGMQAIVDMVCTDPIRVFFVKDKNYTRALIDCTFDKDKIFFTEEGSTIDLSVKAVCKASQVNLFAKNEVKVTLYQKTTLDKSGTIMDACFQGYLEGTRAVLDFVSTDSLGVINYQFYLENKK